MWAVASAAEKGDRDQPAGRHEAEQAQDKQLASPEESSPALRSSLAREDSLRRRACTLAGPQEGQEHDEQGGYGREHSGCERRDAGCNRASRSSPRR